MRIGIPKLDELLGEIELGSTVLIETIGEIGIEIAIEALKRNKEKSAVFLTPRLKKRLEHIFELGEVVYLTLGEDFAPQELFKVTHALRELPEDRFIAVFLIQPLLIFHPSQRVYRFFAELSDIANAQGIILMTMIDKRLVDERTLATFEESATHVIDIVEVIQGFKIIRGLRIKKSPKKISGFYKLKIKDGNVEVGELLG
ncbi:hypothetical protein DRN43_05160 [Thermococci archaeon]|nr:MAG: hypothetical protein DRN43_05160 [Thermococci archaeon]